MNTTLEPYFLKNYTYKPEFVLMSMTGNIEDNDIMEFHNDRPHDIIKIPGVITHWMMHDDYNLTKIKHVEMQIKHRFIHHL